MRWLVVVSVLIILGAVAGCGPSAVEASQREAGKFEVVKSDAEWRRQLGPEAYNVLREKGTERAFTGKLWNHHGVGTYLCAGCDLPLFDSKTKFDSGTGWPSFWKPIKPTAVVYATDYKLGYARKEVMCARCGGHLGHVFEDGPKPTGLRFCMNSVSLKFQKR